MTNTPAHLPEPPVDHWAVIEAALKKQKEYWDDNYKTSAGLAIDKALSSLAALRKDAAVKLAGDAEPVDIGGLHSKIDMDIEDQIGRELTLDESLIVGLAIKKTMQAHPPAQMTTDAGGWDGVDGLESVIARAKTYSATRDRAVYMQNEKDCLALRYALTQRPQTVPDGIDLKKLADSVMLENYQWDKKYVGESREIIRHQAIRAMLKAAAPQQEGAE